MLLQKEKLAVQFTNLIDEDDCGQILASHGEECTHQLLAVANLSSKKPQKWRFSGVNQRCERKRQTQLTHFDVREEALMLKKVA